MKDDRTDSKSKAVFSNITQEAAADCLQQGWSPIRLKPKSKKPNGTHSSQTITWENLTTLREDENLGVQFSEKDRLRDLDPDYQSAADLVRELGLQNSTAAFGRSIGIRHLLFNAPGTKAKKF